jgi:hypothetical protein
MGGATVKRRPVQKIPSRFFYWIVCPQQEFGQVSLLLSVSLFLLVNSVVVSQTGATSDYTQAQIPTNTKATWWQDLNIISMGEIPPEMDHLVNVVGWGGLGETEGQRQWTRRQVERMHQKDGRYVGSISTFDAAAYETYLERPELASTAITDIYGKPIIVWWESTHEKPLWWGNTNDPLWQEFLLEQSKALVDAGVDGILIDEIEGTAAIWSGGSFSEPDMSGFRAYLAASYTQEELLSLFGINDIKTFDYGKYINSLGLADTWVKERWRVPLYDDFLRFQRLATVRFMTELVNETKSYARTTYGREVAFTANIFGLAPSLLIFADLLDYYTVEYPYMDYGYPPESQAIADYKLARALGDKPAVNLAHIATNADLLGRNSSSTLMTIYIAEAYASQGAMMVPYGIYAWSEETGPGVYYGDMSVLAPVYQFIRDNPFLYEELRSLAQVAVLYSFPTNYHRWEYRDSFRGLTYALLDGHIQYDIVALGDDMWLADSFSAASLAPYQLAFMAEAEYLSQAQVDSLLSFVAGGGTLIVWGDTGIYDETGQATERPELASLTMPGTYAYGEGRFIVLTGDPGDTYRQTHDATVRQQLVSLVNNYAGNVTAMSAARTLNLVVYKRAGGSQMVAHLINCDYTIETDQATPTGAFTLTLRPPAGFLDQDEIQLYRLSPHLAESSLLDFTVDNGLLVINHPGVEVYDVLMAVPQADARVLAGETLDTLAEVIAQAVADGCDISSLDDLMSQIDDAATTGNHLLARQFGLEVLELLRALTRPRILFDEVHDERNTLSWERALTLNPEHPEWIYFGAFRAALEDEFAFERNPGDALSPELLQNYDVLMLSAPDKIFDTTELEAVVQFVANGGSLLVLGDCALGNESINTLLLQFGITFDRHCIFAPVPDRKGDFPVTAFADHPATAGVPSIMTSWGGSLKVNAPAVALALTDQDAWQDTNWDGKYDLAELTGPFTIAAASVVGRGRVVAISDNPFQDDGFEWRSNDLLMRSLLRWLTGPR